MIDTVGYQTFLQGLDGAFQTYRVLVEDGAVEVMKQKGTAGDAQIHKALADLNKIALRSPLPNPTEAWTEVQSILANLQPPARRALMQAQNPPQLTSEEIQVRIQRLSPAAWLAWGLITVLSGIAVLILPDPGFGTLQDLLLAFLWGLGISTVLQQLTPSSVSTALGFSLGRP